MDINNLPTIVLSEKSELAERIKSSSESKYKVIRDFIFEKFGNKKLRLSDGLNAIIDKRDAKHIAYQANKKRTAEIAQLEEIIKNAVKLAEDTNVIHNKFDYFAYYGINVEFEGKRFALFLNVGRSKYDGGYHIYDITDWSKKRDTANRINGLERPKPNEGYALKNDVSTDIIDQNKSTVNSKSMQESENNTSKAKEISEADRKKQGERQEKVKSLCDLFGLSLEWDEGIKRGKYNPDTRTVFINPNLTLTEMYIEVLKHEFTHDLENRRLYKKFKEYLFNSSENFIKFCEEEINELKKKGIIGEAATGKDAVLIYRGHIYEVYKNSEEMNDEERAEFDGEAAEREMICNFVSKRLLSRESETECIEALKELAEKQRTVFDRFMDLIRNFIYHIKQTFNKATEADELEYLERRLKQVYDSKIGKNKTAQGGGNKFSLQKYTEHEIDNWKNSKRIVIYENDTQFKEFIYNALSIKNTNKKLYFGKVSVELGNFIKYHTGIDVANYNCSLSANEIRKITKDHGDEDTEIKRGQRAVMPNDFLYIPTVIESPDTIKLSDKLYNGKAAINFVKDGMTVTAVVSDKHLDLFVQTAYINKKGNLATPTAEQAADNTPEASHGTVSDNRVTQKDTSVNSNSMQENEKHSIDLEENVSEREETEKVPEENSSSDNEGIVIPEEATKVTNKYFKGEITKEEYDAEIENIRKKAVGEYGAFETGELAENKKQIPKKVTDDEYVRRMVRTIIESGILPEDIETDVLAEVLKNALSYKRISNKKAQTQADLAVQDGTAVKQWEAAVNGDGKVGKKHIAIGETLLRMAAEQNDARAVMKLVCEISEMATRAGQTVNIYLRKQNLK